MNLRSIAASLAILSCVSFTAQSAIIVATDFDNRNIATGSSTATNLDWFVDGVSALNGLTADAQLFNTTDTSGLFAVARNIQTVSPWSVEIALNVLNQNISLSSLFLDAYIFNNRGITQVTSTTSRDLDFTAVIFNSASQSVAQQQILNVFPSTGSYVPGKTVSFDFSGVTLLANNNYVLRLIASSNEKMGNNAGFDNLSLTGTIQSTSAQSISSPSTMTLFSICILGLILRKKLTR